MTKVPLAVLCLIISLVTAFQGPREDLVVGLPLPGVESAWYSGYLSITKSSQFHYVLFPSKHDPDNAPVLLWLNGGPGCSSLIGMAYENGPFRFLANSTEKVANPYSWNNKANLLYLESPGSVGYSIGPANASDDSVKADNLQAILTFYAKFPALRSQELYLSGESYAGIYVPYLALAIHEYNARPTTALPIRLKGVIVGNACTDPSQCYIVGPNGTSLHQYEFLYRHGFYNDKQYDRLKAACSLSYDSPFCQSVRDELDTAFANTKTPILNIYEKCYGVTGEKEAKKHYSRKLTQSGRRRIVRGDMDCDDQKGAMDFFNNPLVRQALHVSSAALSTWLPCNDDLYQTYKMDPRASYWIYPTLMKAGYRVWIYSGDVDADVPVTGTKNWISKFRQEFELPVMQPWRQWWVRGLHKYEDYVGGMLWQLKGMNFVTIIGAGHMAPKDKPEASYHMLEAFLENKVLPDKQQ